MKSRSTQSNWRRDAAVSSSKRHHPSHWSTANHWSWTGFWARSPADRHSHPGSAGWSGGSPSRLSHVYVHHELHQAEATGTCTIAATASSTPTKNNSTLSLRVSIQQYRPKRKTKPYSTPSLYILAKRQLQTIYTTSAPHVDCECRPNNTNSTLICIEQERNFQPCTTTHNYLLYLQHFLFAHYKIRQILPGMVGKFQDLRFAMLHN